MKKLAYPKTVEYRGSTATIYLQKPRNFMAQGIPDGAFEPIEGDDKKYCINFKNENRK